MNVECDTSLSTCKILTVFGSMKHQRLCPMLVGLGITSVERMRKVCLRPIIIHFNQYLGLNQNNIHPVYPIAIEAYEAESPYQQDKIVFQKSPYEVNFLRIPSVASSSDRTRDRTSPQNYWGLPVSFNGSLHIILTQRQIIFCVVAFSCLINGMMTRILL